MRSSDVKNYARLIGFDLVGVAPIATTPESLFYPEWLDQGHAGEMRYLERQKAARMDPRLLLPDARSVIVCAINYNTNRPLTAFDRLRAWVSRYAWGEDYHETLLKKLKGLARWLENQAGPNTRPTRAFVDTGPVLERVFAKYAGIGWFGKNTCILNEK